MSDQSGSAASLLVHTIMNCPSSATGSAPRGAITALKSLTGMKLSWGAIRSSYHPVRL